MRHLDFGAPGRFHPPLPAEASRLWGLAPTFLEGSLNVVFGPSEGP